MGIVLEPPTAAAGVHIGVGRAEAARQCAVHGDPETFHRGDETVPSLMVRARSGPTIFVYFDDADRVNAVELGRPDNGESVTFLGIDVFGTPADEVIEALDPHAEVNVTDGGHSVTAPSLHIALWRPTVPESAEDPEGRYFESVLVAKPGYDG
ncbi:hypothetical protein ASD62_03775 [Phycicoccus sp. Root563]|uniref:hypothetical protein n=1 Tax=Phycicoccus sp. Root563 TaxID=1736562 RepID=UPI00070357A2|nr:hypothetical protein [Phycicoccus sp. Root563]KQZ88561.1 hypothetical protein ASD62_03775 [Phycicoccus sp. Root563]